MVKQYDKSRRRFVRSVGAAGIAGLAGTSLVNSVRASGTEWHETCDFVIIGSGFAGLAAGIEA